MNRYISTLAIVLFFICSGVAQKTEEERSWNQPVTPFKIVGNVYYVGASDVTSYLITTPKGHILIDSGFPETVSQIKENVAELGFKLSDVKILLNSHAHYDHAGGLAELKRLTGAKLYISRPDEALFLNGGLKDPNFDDRFPFESVKPDRLLGDRGKVTMGGTTMTANLTAGHTPGCTSWSMTTRENGKNLNVIFVCSTTSPGYKLVNNSGYPSIADDYARTFDRLRKMKVDVFLSSHGGAFGLLEKIKHLGQGRNPFIDPQGFRDYITSSETAFRKKLEEQKSSGR